MTPNKLYLLFLAHCFFGSVACGGHDDQIPTNLEGTWKSADGAEIAFSSSGDIAVVFKDAPELGSPPCFTQYEFTGTPSFDEGSSTVAIHGTDATIQDDSQCGGAVTTSAPQTADMSAKYQVAADALTLTVERCPHLGFEAPCAFEMTRQ